jgi:predicted dehydrogenase
MHLAELAGGILAKFCFSITVGEDRFSWLIVGDEGSLRIPDSGTIVVRQRHDDDEPIELEIASADKAVLSTDLQQHTWNRLIEDFIGAVRNDDKDHESHPSLPPSPTASAPKKSSRPPAGRVTLAVGRPWADEGALEGNNGD